jgi:hypothetical protein
MFLMSRSWTFCGIGRRVHKSPSHMFLTINSSACSFTLNWKGHTLLLRFCEIKTQLRKQRNADREDGVAEVKKSHTIPLRQIR